MKEEKRKEILTREIIKNECIKICGNSIKRYLLSYLVLIPLFYLEYLIITTDASQVGIVIIAIVIFGWSLWLLWEMIHCIKLLIKIKQNNFDILEDQLVEKVPRKELVLGYDDRAHYLSAIFDSGLFARYRYRLYFKNLKQSYCIPFGMNYSWSNNFMNHFRVYDSSEFGDSFYLMVIKKELKIVLAYNKKLFEME
ncbi:MAG: hypothetical protein IKJ93_03160 [Clostridia bacterium]|nr:hypothetical protein [Clostridia bacterium]